MLDGGTRHKRYSIGTHSTAVTAKGAGPQGKVRVRASLSFKFSVS